MQILFFLPSQSPFLNYSQLGYLNLLLAFPLCASFNHSPTHYWESNNKLTSWNKSTIANLIFRSIYKILNSAVNTCLYSWCLEKKSFIIDLNADLNQYFSSTSIYLPSCLAMHLFPSWKQDSYTNQAQSPSANRTADFRYDLWEAWSLGIGRFSDV